MSTFFMKKEQVKHKKWHVVDAKDQVVGRLAARISRILMGKNKTSYTPHVDSGDGVIAINASQVRVTFVPRSKPPSEMSRRTTTILRSEPPWPR